MRNFPKALTCLAVLLCLVPARRGAADDGVDDAAAAYATAGVIELGGFTHFMLAKGYSSLGFYPTCGWFLWDNIELSMIVGATREAQTIENEDGRSAEVSRTELLVLGEPSFHVPFSEAVYGFFGIGLGLAHQARSPGPGAGPGFAMAPRLGLNLVVARSGILTPAVQARYQTTQALTTSNGSALAGHSSLGFQAGYTITW